MANQSRVLTVLWITSLFVANAVAEQPTGLSLIDKMVVHANQHANGEAPYSFDQSVYEGAMTELPIGVFDSGIGGLTVLEAILSLDAFDNDSLRPGPDGRPDFEKERFIYLGDQANMPYGNYASHDKVDFLRELILKDTVFLLGKRSWDSQSASQPRFDKPPVKAIVIACNTATAYGLDDIRLAIQKWNIPVIVVGVVESGARGVNELISAADEPKTIAVMATVGTCSSMAYSKAIGSATGIAGKRIPTVIQQGSIALAGAIEGDPAFVKSVDDGPSSSVDDYIRGDVMALVESYRQTGATAPIEMVVLGCTHFPLVQDEILDAFERLRTKDAGEGSQGTYQHLIAERIQIVNPAELVAKELYRRLATERLRITGERRCVLKEDAFYLSVPSADMEPSLRTADGDLTVAYKYGRETDQLQMEDTRAVPLRVDMLPTSSRQLIQNRLPEVWQRLNKPTH